MDKIGNIVMLVVYIAVFAVGVYLIAAAFHMKRTGEIDSLILEKEENAKCKKKKEFIAFIAWKEEALGMILAVVGVIGGIGEVAAVPDTVKYLSAALLLAAFVWFYQQLKRAKEQFL